MEKKLTDSTSLTGKNLLEVLQYAYQKGESSLHYSTSDLIKEMKSKLNPKRQA